MGVLDTGTTLPTGEPAVCGGDVPLEGCVYIVDSVSGSDLADGRTVATAWKTLDKAATTITRDAAKVVLIDDSDFSSETLDVPWTGLSDNPIIIGTGYVDTADSTLRWFDFGTGGGKGAKARVFNVIPSTTPVTNFQMRDVDDTAGQKGWWWQQFGNLSNEVVSASSLSNPNFKGFMFEAIWRHLETGFGVYNWADLDAMVALCKANDKRFMLFLSTVRFSSGQSWITTGSGINPWVPQYMWNDTQYGQQDFGGGNLLPAGAHLMENTYNVTANYHVQAVEDREIALSQAVYDRYGADPMFAGMMAAPESAVTAPVTENGASDFGWSRLLQHTHLQQMAIQTKAIWGADKVVMSGVNFLSSSSLYADVEAYIDDLTAKNVAVSGPDLRPCYVPPNQLARSQRRANIDGGNWDNLIGGYQLDPVWTDPTDSGYTCDAEADRPLAFYNHLTSIMDKSTMCILDIGGSFTVGSPSLQTIVNDPVTYPFPLP